MDKFLLTIQPYLSILKDCVTILSLMIASYVACKGLYTWRKELTAKKDYDLARRILTACINVTDSIAHVRSPIILTAEMVQAIKKTKKEVSDQINDFPMQGSIAVYTQRWKRISKSYKSLKILVSEAEAVWGSEIRDSFEKLNKCIGEFNYAVNCYMTDENYGTKNTLDPNIRENYQKILYSMSTDSAEDPYLKNLETVVAEIRKIARPYLL